MDKWEDCLSESDYGSTYDKYVHLAALCYKKQLNNQYNCESERDSLKSYETCGTSYRSCGSFCTVEDDEQERTLAADSLSRAFGELLNKLLHILSGIVGGNSTLKSRSEAQSSLNLTGFLFNIPNSAETQKDHKISNLRDVRNGILPSTPPNRLDWCGEWLTDQCHLQAKGASGDNLHARNVSYRRRKLSSHEDDDHDNDMFSCVSDSSAISDASSGYSDESLTTSSSSAGDTAASSSPALVAPARCGLVSRTVDFDMNHTVAELTTDSCTSSMPSLPTPCKDSDTSPESSSESQSASCSIDVYMSPRRIVLNKHGVKAVETSDGSQENSCCKSGENKHEIFATNSERDRNVERASVGEVIRRVNTPSISPTCSLRVANQNKTMSHSSPDLPTEPTQTIQTRAAVSEMVVKVALKSAIPRPLSTSVKTKTELSKTDIPCGQQAQATQLDTVRTAPLVACQFPAHNNNAPIQRVGSAMEAQSIAASKTSQLQDKNDTPSLQTDLMNTQQQTRTIKQRSALTCDHHHPQCCASPTSAVEGRTRTILIPKSQPERDALFETDARCEDDDCGILATPFIEPVDEDIEEQHSVGLDHGFQYGEQKMRFVKENTWHRAIAEHDGNISQECSLCIPNGPNNTVIRRRSDTKSMVSELHSNSQYPINIRGYDAMVGDTCMLNHCVYEFDDIGTCTKRVSQLSECGDERQTNIHCSANIRYSVDHGTQTVTSNDSRDTGFAVHHMPIPIDIRNYFEHGAPQRIPCDNPDWHPAGYQTDSRIPCDNPEWHPTGYQTNSGIGHGASAARMSPLPFAGYTQSDLQIRPMLSDADHRLAGSDTQRVFFANAVNRSNDGPSSSLRKPESRGATELRGHYCGQFDARHNRVVEHRYPPTRATEHRVDTHVDKEVQFISREPIPVAVLHNDEEHLVNVKRDVCNQPPSAITSNQRNSEDIAYIKRAISGIRKMVAEQRMSDDVRCLRRKTPPVSYRSVEKVPVDVRPPPVRLEDKHGNLRPEVRADTEVQTNKSVDVCRRRAKDDDHESRLDTEVSPKIPTASASPVRRPTAECSRADTSGKADIHLQEDEVVQLLNERSGSGTYRRGKSVGGERSVRKERIHSTPLRTTVNGDESEAGPRSEIGPTSECGTCTANVPIVDQPTDFTSDDGERNKAAVDVNQQLIAAPASPRIGGDQYRSVKSLVQCWEGVMRDDAKTATATVPKTAPQRTESSAVTANLHRTPSPCPTQDTSREPLQHMQEPAPTPNIRRPANPRPPPSNGKRTLHSRGRIPVPIGNGTSAVLAPPSTSKCEMVRTKLDDWRAQRTEHVRADKSLPVRRTSVKLSPRLADRAPQQHDPSTTMSTERDANERCDKSAQGGRRLANTYAPPRGGYLGARPGKRAESQSDGLQQTTSVGKLSKTGDRCGQPSKRSSTRMRANGSGKSSADESGGLCDGGATPWRLRQALREQKSVTFRNTPISEDDKLRTSSDKSTPRGDGRFGAQKTNARYSNL